jgi:hypothetical protein
VKLNAILDHRYTARNAPPMQGFSGNYAEGSYNLHLVWSGPVGPQKSSDSTAVVW